MNDSKIIWKTLYRVYYDEHPIIYFYVCGGVNTRKQAIDKVMELLIKIYYPMFDKLFLKEKLIVFLDYKKIQYINNEIKIKKVYHI